jgi:predicted DNA-binding transcriptional regulator YafY
MVPVSEKGPAPRTRSTAETQLERILYILPRAAREGGASIDELARALDVEPATILRDLEDATARSFHHPGGTVESFSIVIDRRHVRVHAPLEFRRPVRLSAREALALGLGLRTLAAEAEVDRRAGILDLARRLETRLVAPAPSGLAETRVPHLVQRIAEPELEYDAAPLTLAFDDDGFRGIVADAIELGVLCSILYLKPGQGSPERRTIAPHRLIHAEGMWYVAADDTAREGLRFFRMDRILDTELLDAAAPPPPPDLDETLAAGAPFIAEAADEVEVRYSPRIAPWICERTACTPASDGTAVVRHRVADERWLVRHVLQYGGEAEVTSPAAVRDLVARAAEAIAADVAAAS